MWGWPEPQGPRTQPTAARDRDLSRTGCSTGIGGSEASVSRVTHLLLAFTPVRGGVMWPLALWWQMSRTANAFQSMAANVSLFFEKALSCLLTWKYTDAISLTLETPRFCLGRNNARALSHLYNNVEPDRRHMATFPEPVRALTSWQPAGPKSKDRQVPPRRWT